jgi:crossover junction endodeoxyribonuclease RuvC
MIVLAIDPGYGRCGVAVISSESSGVHLLHSDCIHTPATQPFHRRLVTITQEVERLLHTYHATLFAIETLFFNSNQKTAMMVAEVRGALLYLATKNNVAIAEYTPLEVKQAIAGYGRGDKKQMMSMIPKLIRVEKEIQYDDEYDAIAIGLTALARQKMEKIAKNN